jgi:hypothetical protein
MKLFKNAAINLVIVIILSLPSFAQAQGIAHRVADLEAAVAALQAQATTLPPPTYDSGWQPIDPRGTLVLHHNLGVNLGVSTDNMVVNLQFQASDELGAGINNQFYGTGYTLANFKGAYWYGLTEDRISVFREMYDESAEQVRVRIWLHR